MDFSNLPISAPDKMPAPQAQAPTAAPIYTPPPSQCNGRHRWMITIRKPIRNMEV
jgi:hypothetical protein